MITIDRTYSLIAKTLDEKQMWLLALDRVFKMKEEVKDLKIKDKNPDVETRADKILKG